MDFENLATPQLNLFLKEFYFNLRQTNGELYNTSSFIVIGQRINRFLKHPPVNRVVDIIKDSAFDSANNAFSSMCKRMRQDGKGEDKSQTFNTERWYAETIQWSLRV
jgi:hypothetical protein